MANYVSTSKDVGNSKSGGGGNSANIGNQAIGAYGNQRTVAPSAGGGVIRTPAQAQATANPGSKANPQRNINQPPANPAYGYEPGSFDDPTIDWQAIYNAMVAPSLSGPAGGDSGGGYSGGGGMGGGGMQSIAPPSPMVMENPASITAPSIQMPAVVNSAASSVANAPEGQKFTTFGAPSSFGGFERQRNQRGPTNNASMTPEMLRRAAASRLG